MKKLLFILLCVPLIGLGQQTGCIEGDCKNGYGIWTYSGNKYEGDFLNGRRHGKGTYTWAHGWKYEGEWDNHRMHGQGTIYDPDGRTIQEGMFRDNFFYDNIGTKIFIEKYDEYIPDPIGEMICKTTLIDGKKEGKSTCYHSNGKLWIECYYINDVKNGTYKWYFENGKLFSECNYVNGEKGGIERQYHSTNGTLSHIIKWTNGVKIEYIAFHDNGKLFAEAKFKKGKRDGAEKLYNKNGQLVKKTIYKDGQVISIICFDQNMSEIECD